MPDPCGAIFSRTIMSKDGLGYWYHRIQIDDDQVRVLETRYIDKPSEGLGDTVAKTIKKVTGGKLKPCGGCKKRQRRLNELVPYGKG